MTRSGEEASGWRPEVPGAGRRATAHPADSSPSLLDALPAEVVMLAADGRIVSVNAAWRRHADAHGLAWPDAGVGASYLAACDRAGPHDQIAAEAASGIRAVLQGQRERFELTYPCSGPDDTRWYRLHATRHGAGAHVRAVVVHEDVTELKRAEEALHDLTARLLLAQDEERRRIARDLHDGTAPTMVGLSLDIARLEAALPEGELRELARGCAALCEQSLGELRTVTFLLHHPPLLERSGLVEALRWLADGFGRRSGIAIDLEVEGAVDERLAPEVELALYRVVQEALTNVHRHSGSRSAAIRLCGDAKEVRLMVADEGGAAAGWEGGGGGVGIPGMRERLRVLGGRLEIAAAPAGTAVTATVPRRRAR